MLARSRKILRVMGVIAVVLKVSGCGEFPSSQELAMLEIQGDAGYVQLSVSGLRSSSHTELATISEYKIIVEKEGGFLLEQTVSNEALGIVFENLPTGKFKRIRLQALNKRGQILREGEAENVVILPGQKAEVSIVLKSVPLLLNVEDGDTLSNQRLFFRIFSDPGHKIVVENGAAMVNDLSGNTTLMIHENGEAQFYSADFQPGDHSFILRDLDSQKSVSVLLHLWDGAKIGQAPLFAGSRNQASEGIAMRLGQSLTRAGNSHPAGSELFPDIAEALWLP